GLPGQEAARGPEAEEPLLRSAAPAWLQPFPAPHPRARLHTGHASAWVPACGYICECVYPVPTAVVEPAEYVLLGKPATQRLSTPEHRGYHKDRHGDGSLAGSPEDTVPSEGVVPGASPEDLLAHVTGKSGGQRPALLEPVRALTRPR
ncbi:hypothetical protein P7K49_005838, partial [Saguinus oedipus]